MAVSPRLIKRRIKSIANTRKITKAMELVAASKMRKAVQQTLASRDYAGTVKLLVDDIRRRVHPETHPFLYGRMPTEEEPLKTLVLVAASDRGLCGGFNAQLLKKTLEFLRGRQRDQLRIVTVGRRAEGAIRRAGYELVASFEAISNAPSYERALPVGQLVIDAVQTGDADRVFLIYTDFRSALLQIPAVEQLLPLAPEEAAPTSPMSKGEPLFEPDASYVLEQLLPRLIETRVYQALLESSASEHSARMMAMRSATDNASGMLDDLTFTYNQARQAGITREISEISAGKAAIE